MKRSFIRTLPLGMMCTLMCNNLTAQEVDFDLSSQRSEIQNVSRVSGEKRTDIDWVINLVPHKIALNSSKLLDVSNGVEENAFNGGFFIKNNEISAESLSVNKLNSILKSTTVEIVDGVIKMTDIQTQPEPVRQDLFNTSRGDGVTPPYRILGITTAQSGRLIVAAARLVCGTDSGYGQVDVVCRYSDNHGETWSDMIDVAVGTGVTSATENYFNTAFGDPAIVADRTSNEVLIIAVAGCTVYGNGNTTRQNPNFIAAIHSADNGETWGEPVNVTEQIYNLFDSGNPLAAAFVGGGKIFQSRIVKKDKYYRLYAAMCARPNGNRVIYSDDFGRTWHALGGDAALPAPDGDEPKCEEMPDGRVILSSRVGGGRIYNIYTYENTMEATGKWATAVKGTFSGSGLTPEGNSTNGEIMIIPVERTVDSKPMYLALQSLPTGEGRTNVGIYYKELTDMTDMNSVENFCTDWNGFHQVSTTASAYSSMDLQADGKIGFIYEETLTNWGKRNNPVSTSFPTGAGQHNFDGFDNIYLAMDVEYITNGAYKLKLDVDRKAFLKIYFTSVLAAQTEIADELKTRIETAIANLSTAPTTIEMDTIYALFKENKPEDK
ncbi:sialidase family protein [Phocaeicola faecalis]